MTDVKSDSISRLELRILVLALGESSPVEWWKSKFLSPVGLSFLNRLYPRSYFGAAVRSAIAAAKVVHDNSIGLGSVFHLFRLPQDIERSLNDILTDHEADLRAKFMPILNRPELLMEQLAGLRDSVPSSAAVGPLRIGTVKDLRKMDWTPFVASTYHAAFLHAGKVFPYFESERKVQ